MDYLSSEIKRTGSDSPFKILINALHARSGGGVTYLQNMLPLLAKDKNLELHVCLHEDQSEILPTHLDRVDFHYARYRRGFWRVLFREQIDLPRLARRLMVDATFSPANYGPFFAKNHTVMIRNAVSVGFVERRPVKLAYWALLYLATMTSLFFCRNAIAVSDYAKRGIEGRFSTFLRGKIAVIPHGVNPMYLERGEAVPRQGFLLCVSDIYVQKNYIRLIKALSKISQSIPDIRLKVAGRAVDQQYFDSLKDLIAQENLEDNVDFLGHVTPRDLKSLYQRCQIFVFPSTVETFGNPLVEAMACGAPIASSNAAAMPEVVGDAAAFFDPNNIDDMASVLLGLICDPDERARLAEGALLRARFFSWEETKRRTIDVIQGKPDIPLR